MLNDLLYLLIWWGYFLALGLIFFPLTSRIFKSFFDKGYIFSKVIGLAITSYLVWLLASLHILAFSHLSIYIVLGLVVLCSLYSYFKFKTEIKGVWKYLILEEGLFLIGLLFFAYLRGVRPEILTLEKFMDFGLVNTILRAKYMPPQDMWYSGFSVNYYYFGHFVTALLVKITHLKSSIGYNLMIATLFSLTLGLTFSLTGNIIYQKFKSIPKVVIGGLISALIMVLGSNFQTVIFAWILPFFKNIGWYHNDVVKYYYANATRFIGYSPPTDDKTIHEFPSYSFIVSDLHAHVLNLPFVLTFLALLFVTIITIRSYDLKFDRELFLKIFKIPKLYLLLALFLSIFYMTNLWDFLIYSLVLLGVLIYARRSIELNIVGTLKTINDFGKIVLLSIFLALPFIIHFKNTTLGLRFSEHHTPLYQLLILWGSPLIMVAGYLIFLSIKRRQFYLSFNQKRTDFMQALMRHVNHADLFVITLIIVALFCLIVPEIIFVKDIYIKEYERANTMFKFSYQAYVMLTISTGYIVIRLISAIHRYKYVIIILMILILGPVLIYPYYSIKGYYKNIRFSNYHYLDGENFFQTKMPAYYEAIQYLKKTSRQPIILEASGDSYTEYNSTSSYTGLPTILGWRVHEWLWRGNLKDLEKRAVDVKNIYTTNNPEEAKMMVKSYDIAYIIIGQKELEAYEVNLENLKTLGDIVFETPEIKIIKIK